MRVGARLALSGTRLAIDQVDDAMIALLAGRRRLAAAGGRLKAEGNRPLRDAAREAQVHRRAQWLADRLRVPPETARQLVALLIADACNRQADSFSLSVNGNPPAMSNAGNTTARTTLLRLIPPPRRWRPLLAMVPGALRDGLASRVLSHAIAGSLQDSALQAIAGRRLGIEASDLGLSWVLELRGDRLQAGTGTAEASVRGSATDLLLLASRLEDADTLFFQRRLMLTGDTELGLTVRNLLDRMPWEQLPLGLRIVLQRGARLARDARDAHRTHEGARA